MMCNIAQNDQKSTRIILCGTGFFNGLLVLELWLIVDQVALKQSVAYVCSLVYGSSNRPELVFKFKICVELSQLLNLLRSHGVVYVPWQHKATMGQRSRKNGLSCLI
jgi:hypothetical protein